MLALYRELLAVRRAHAVLREGELAWLDGYPESVLAFRLTHGDGGADGGSVGGESGDDSGDSADGENDRGGRASAVVVLNTGADPVALPPGRVLTASVPLADLGEGLPADAAAVVLE